MADHKTIAVDERLWRALWEEKRPDETWTDTIERLTGITSDSWPEVEA